MGTCYSVHGKGEPQSYITVKPLSRNSPILQGDAADLSSHSSSPVKGLGDIELPTKSVLKNSANWSQTSSPLFEKKVDRRVSFDLMSELVLPSSESSPLKQTTQESEGSATNGSVTGEQNKANTQSIKTALTPVRGAWVYIYPRYIHIGQLVHIYVAFLLY